MSSNIVFEVQNVYYSIFKITMIKTKKNPPILDNDKMTAYYFTLFTLNVFILVNISKEYKTNKYTTQE